MKSPAFGPSSGHRLRGQVDGVEHILDLTIGEHRLGSSRANDLQLSVPGVSREHAWLSVTPGGLSVEDRCSKNGTFVDGRRVERASVVAGARVGFGPAELELAVGSETLRRAAPRRFIPTRT